MKKFTCALTAVILFNTSCKKSGDDKDKDPDPIGKTSQEIIVGKWKSVYLGADSNANSVWDSTEKIIIPDSYAIYEIYKANDSLISYGDSIAMLSTYALTPDGKRVIKPSRLPPYIHFDTVTLDQLDDSILIYHKADGALNHYTQWLRVN